MMSQHAQNPLTRASGYQIKQPEGDLSAAPYRPRHEAVGKAWLYGKTQVHIPGSIDRWDV